jgi:hypothetical protein
METWRNKQLHATCRIEDPEGVDAGNLPLLTLAVQEVRQVVSDTLRFLMGMEEQEGGLIGLDQ